MINKVDKLEQYDVDTIASENFAFYAMHAGHSQHKRKEKEVLCRAMKTVGNKPEVKKTISRICACSEVYLQESCGLGCKFVVPDYTSM